MTKVHAAENTPLKIFAANLRCTPETLKAGGAGHCGIIANVCPEHCVTMCNGSDPELRNQAYESAQIMHDIMCACDYLPAAKYILNHRGLNMGNICRSTNNVLSDTARRLLEYTLPEFNFHTPISNASIIKLRTKLNQTYPGK
jgi:dihydrodipicolinate synthase/N-acetylneuraminate lyase